MNTTQLSTEEYAKVFTIFDDTRPRYTIPLGYAMGRWDADKETAKTFKILGPDGESIGSALTWCWFAYCYDESRNRSGYGIEKSWDLFVWTGGKHCSYPLLSDEERKDWHGWEAK